MARGKRAPRLRHLMVDREALLVDGSDADFRQFVYDTIAFTARMKTALEKHAKIVGLPSPQYMILASVIHLSDKQDVNIKTIADHLHITGSFVTNNVTALVREGLLEKRVDSNDRRRVQIQLTKAAWQRFARLADVQNRVNNVMFEPLSREEFLLMRSIMSRLLDSAERAITLLSHLELEAKAKS